MPLTNLTSDSLFSKVWTKAGTMAGYEHNQAAWTKVADHTFLGAAAWNILQFPAFNEPVHISAGETQSFYVIHKNGGKALFSGGHADGFNSLDSEDDNLQIFRGYYNVYPFAGKGGGSNTWQGTLTYMSDGGEYIIFFLPPSSSH